MATPTPVRSMTIDMSDAERIEWLAKRGFPCDRLKRLSGGTLLSVAIEIEWSEWRTKHNVK
jgi:hypothetical protein